MDHLETMLETKPNGQEFPLFQIIDPKEISAYFHKNIYTRIILALILITTPKWKQPKYSSVGD